MPRVACRPGPGEANETGCQASSKQCETEPVNLEKLLPSGLVIVATRTGYWIVEKGCPDKCNALDDDGDVEDPTPSGIFEEKVGK